MYKLLSLNCQCLTNIKVDYITSDFLSEYKDLEILCLGETWCNEDNINLVYFNNFCKISSFCRSRSKGGGVAIWCKNTLSAQPLILEAYCIERDFEICGVKIVKHSVKTVILNCYRAPNTCFDTFCDRLNDVMGYVFKPNINFIVCGDLNVDPTRDKYNFERLINIMDSFKIVNTIFEKTRLNSTLDYVFSNVISGSSSVIDVHYSDHKAVLFSVADESAPVNNAEYRRDFSHQNIQNFLNDISNENWNTVLATDDVDESFNIFHSIYSTYFNQHFPLKIFHKGTKKDWINEAVKISSRDLKNLFELTKVFPELSDSYRKAKRRHSLLVKDTKRSFYQNKIKTSNNSTKTVWGIVNQLSNKNKQYKNINIKKDNNIISDPKEVAKLFNEFFIETVNDLGKSINKIPYKDEIKSHQCSMFLFPFTDIEFRSLISRKLKPKKSCGVDDIPGFLVKQSLDFIYEPLVHLVNRSFLQATFPDKLKISKIIPLYKKGDSEQLMNYRPIALSATFSKVFEYCFLERLLGFLDKYKILSGNQFGFRPKYCTIDAIYAFLGAVVDGIESGGCPAGIFCDLSRAFDCVVHSVLLKKLIKYGIRGNPCKWIADFLNDRTQFVSIEYVKGNKHEKVSSDLLSNEVGVPQGSILGPVLFLLYINDIVGSMKDNVYLYADDATVIVSSADGSSLRGDIQNNLDSLQLWFNRNVLHINKSKTTYTVYHNFNKTVSDVDVMIDSTALKRVESVRFLGLEVDECLTWRSQCRSVRSGLNSSCFLIRNLRDVLTFDQLMSVYYAQVHSKISYGIVFWGSSSAAVEVFLCQKKIVRCMVAVPRTASCRPLFRSLKILTLPSLYILEVASLIYKKQKQFLRHADQHHYDTRNKMGFILPNFGFRIGRKSPIYLGLEIFNRLDVSIKNSESLGVFRYRLKKFLIDKCYYNISEFLS